MNYLEARPLSDKSGWHMTIRNDDRIWPHQCCCTKVPATEEDVKRLDWIYHGNLKVGDPITGPAHEPHATRKEAEDCYHEWRLAEIRSTCEFDDSVFGDWTGCVICDSPTKGGARYRDDHLEHVALCPEHRDIEIVLGRVGRVTRSIYS